MEHRKEEPSPDTEGAQSKSNAFSTKMKDFWRAAGINAQVVKLMIKHSLTGTLVLAVYQSDAFSSFYATLGYLAAIIAILAGATRPRASFLQLLLTSIFLACLATALVILAMYCCIKARETSVTSATGQTSGEAANGVQTAAYNSSASAVAGVWLFVFIYAISVVRARMPQHTVPCVIFCIVVIVSLVYVPQLDTIPKGLAFSRNFLLAVLTGLAMATGVSLFIFPTTCRSEVFHTMDSYISHIRAALEAQMTYLHSLEHADMFAAQRTNTAGEKPPRSAEAEGFRVKMRETTAVYSKLVANMTFAKREIALGKLGPTDMQNVFNHLQPLLVPMNGLSYVSDLFDRLSMERGWDRSRNLSCADIAEADGDDERARIMSINEWHELIRRLKEPFGKVVEAIDEGLQHVAVVLDLPSKKNATCKSDPEKAQAGRPSPGDKDFAQHLNRASQEFLESKKIMLQSWCALHGIHLDHEFFENPSNKAYNGPEWMNVGSSTEEHRRVRQQLAIMLYIEYTFHYVSRRTYELVVAVDSLKASGKLSKKRLIVPGFKRLRKWATEAFFREQHDSEAHGMDAKPNFDNVQFGAAFKKKDPEHLPPETTWERLTDHVRGVAHFLASPASHFAFRVAVATMCVAIMSFLEDTQVFYTTNRLFWAEIMICIGMQPSAGFSLQMFILRVLATTAATITSWIAWYIVDGQPAGVIVFFFVFALPSTWLTMRWPQYATVGTVYTITMVLILGYELQVQKIGVQKAQSNGQRYYPIYIIGPIRLAAVVVGLTIAWIFTIFPYPISEHSRLRKSLGTSLHLLTRYHAIMHRVIGSRLLGTVGDPSVKGSPAHRLQKTRLQLFAQCSATISALKTQATATKLDIPIGGKFPLKQYNRLIESMENLLNYMTIVGIAAAGVLDLLKDQERHGLVWVQNLRRLNTENGVATEAITALLSQLSSAIITGYPLPPYLRVPERYQFARRIEEMDNDILSIRHLAEPGYAVFAVVLIGSKCITDDLQDVLDGVRDLVGELDFSYHVPGHSLSQGDCVGEDLLPKGLQNKED